MKSYFLIFILTILSNVLFADQQITNEPLDIAKLRLIDEPVVLEEEKAELTFEDKIKQSTPDTQEFIKKIKSINSMQADFTQSESLLEAKDTKVINTISGSMQLVKPNKIKWQVNSPESEKQVYVTNGEKFWHYDVNLEQVVVDDFKINRVENSPFYFLLTNPENISEQFEITKTDVNNYKLKAAAALNKESNYISNIELTFKDDDNLKAISFVAANNKLIKIEFESITLNSKLSNHSFNFKAPPGVDTINASELN